MSEIRRNCIGGPEAEIAIRDRRIAELEAALQVEILRYSALENFCDTEMHWEFFRGEMLGDNVSDKNALKLREFLAANPRVDIGPTACLDAALAGAKREALEAAADKAKAVGEAGVGRFPSLTESELRRMAREVKP